MAHEDSAKDTILTSIFDGLSSERRNIEVEEKKTKEALELIAEIDKKLEFYSQKKTEMDKEIEDGKNEKLNLTLEQNILEVKLQVLNEICENLTDQIEIKELEYHNLKREFSAESKSNMEKAILLTSEWNCTELGRKFRREKESKRKNENELELATQKNNPPPPKASRTVSPNKSNYSSSATLEVIYENIPATITKPIVPASAISATYKNQSQFISKQKQFEIKENFAIDYSSSSIKAKPKEKFQQEKEKSAYFLSSDSQFKTIPSAHPSNLNHLEKFEFKTPAPLTTKIVTVKEQKLSEIPGFKPASVQFSSAIKIFENTQKFSRSSITSQASQGPGQPFTGINNFNFPMPPPVPTPKFTFKVKNKPTANLKID